MSKEMYRKQIVTLRARLANEREAKKRDNARYARQVKLAGNPTSKASIRRSKISCAASHDRQIENLRNQIATAQSYLRRAQ